MTQRWSLEGHYHAVMVDLSYQCVDKDKEIARLEALVALTSSTMLDCNAKLLDREAEITRLTALCKEPVVLTLTDLELPETAHEHDMVVLAITLINKKLEQRK